MWNIDRDVIKKQDFFKFFYASYVTIVNECVCGNQIQMMMMMIGRWRRREV